MAKKVANKTMIGVAAPAIAPSPAPVPLKPVDPPKPRAAAAMRTVLGVAVPGIAPTERAAPAAKPPPNAAKNRTMLGVAAPGIAPTRPGGPAPAAPAPPLPIVPAPAPLEEMAAPPPPAIAAKRGVPVVVVAIAAGGLLLVGGVGLALVYRSGPSMTAEPRSSADGKDVLHLACDPADCKDGTVVELSGEKATFRAGEADLPLAQPLSVGQNMLALTVDRPAMGRDETVKLVVPVAYRVRADVTTTTAPRPIITVRVEAVPGTEVRVDDKPVALDAHGAGSYPIDVSAQTEGPADESRVVSLDVPYVVTRQAGGKRIEDKGTVSARVGVAPLRVDAPGARAVVEGDHVLVAGRAARGASVTVDGASVQGSPEGAFEAPVALGADGERTIEVRASTQALAPRTVRVVVKRVPKLADEARAFEARKTVGWDEAARDIARAAGQPIVVEGEVLESRAAGHRTVVLVDDRRGCAKGPCVTRVLVGGDAALERGKSIRAYGEVARTFKTSSGESVPEVDAEFVLGSRR